MDKDQIMAIVETWSAIQVAKKENQSRDYVKELQISYVLKFSLFLSSSIDMRIW